MASISLQALYTRMSLIELDLVLLFVASFLAGAVLVDIKAIVFSCAGALCLYIVTIFVCLTLPAAVGRLEHPVLRDLLFQGVLLAIFKATFPIPLVLCFVGGFLGGLVAERLRLY